MIGFDTEALDDLDGLFEFLAEHDPEAAADHIEKLRSVVTVLVGRDRPANWLPKAVTWRPR